MSELALIHAVCSLCRQDARAEFLPIHNHGTCACLLSGDFRMYFGENPDKVKNIVSATVGEFQDLYAPALKVHS